MSKALVDDSHCGVLDDLFIILCYSLKIGLTVFEFVFSYKLKQILFWPLTEPYISSHLQLSASLS